jgi:membrane associated rhomboid family serine protease
MLISANAAVFIAMRFPFAAHVLHRNFSHSITNRYYPSRYNIPHFYLFNQYIYSRVSTFILSCFGHSGPLHIALNMYMLYTFFPV